MRILGLFEIIESESFVCDKNLKLQRAGHMLLSPNNLFVRLAKSTGLENSLKLSGREKVFNTVEDCICHHRRKNIIKRLPKK